MANIAIKWSGRTRNKEKKERRKKEVQAGRQARRRPSASTDRYVLQEKSRPTSSSKGERDRTDALVLVYLYTNLRPSSLPLFLFLSSCYSSLRRSVHSTSKNPLFLLLSDIGSTSYSDVCLVRSNAVWRGFTLRSSAVQNPHLVVQDVPPQFSIPSLQTQTFWDQSEYFGDQREDFEDQRENITESRGRVWRTKNIGSFVKEDLCTGLWSSEESSNHQLLV